MKVSLVISSFVFLFLSSSFAQGKIDTLYFNRDFARIKTGETYHYYGLVMPIEKRKDSVIIYNDQEVLFSRQMWRNGSMHGQCVWYHENGEISETGYYRNGKPVGEQDFYDVSRFHIRTVVYSKRHKAIAEYYISKSEKRVYTICDRLSSFGDYKREIKSQRALGEFITKELVKPAVVDQIVDPVVVADFLISPNGEIEDLEIVYSADMRLNQAVMDLIAKMPNWRPAIYNGEPVYSQMSISISF